MLIKRVLFLFFLWSSLASFVYFISPKNILLISLFLVLLFLVLFFTFLIISQKVHRALLLSLYLTAVLILRLNQLAIPLYLFLLTLAVLSAEIYLSLDKK
jgi:hypothetical protein